MAIWKRGPWNSETQLVTSNGILVCPVCEKEYRDNHILQCQDGHLFCEACDKRNRCVTCSKPMTRRIRNRQLEHISATTNILEVLGVTTAVSKVPKQPKPEPQKGPRCENCKTPDLQVWYKCLECGSSDKVICEKCLEEDEYSSWRRQRDRDTGLVRCSRHPLLRITSHDQAGMATNIATEYGKVILAIKNHNKKAKVEAATRRGGGFMRPRRP